MLSLQMWDSCLVNRIMVLVTMVLFLIEVRDLFRLFPNLWRCIPFWKGNLDLEHSVSQARTRNTLALVTALVLCIIADRWELLAPSFKYSLPMEWQLPLSIGMVSGYIVLRRLAFLASPFRSRTSEYAVTLRHSVYNYQILLSTLMLISVLLLGALKISDTLIRNVLLVETAIFTLLYLMRAGQILASRCNSLLTILYLCALEILPLGILVFVCTL